MVYGGRKEYVSILDCYLQRNLVRNGGWLDEVMWIHQINRTMDVVYLHDLADHVPEYTSHELYTHAGDGLDTFTNAYKLCQPNTYCVKIDDDIVFMEDNAIQALVQRKIENAQYLIVSANVLNQPDLSWVHYQLDTARPYLPELQKPVDFVDDDRRFMVDWRPSTLPVWEGPEDLNFSATDPAPFNGHRWLPVPGGDIENTPIAALGRSRGSEHVKNHTGYISWTVAAQAHYSFLENLEQKRLQRYKFDIWNSRYEARSIHFIAFSGDDATIHPVQGYDDIWWTSTLPSKLRRPAVVDGTAMVVHFGTHLQTQSLGGNPGPGLRETDLLRRYRSYANEFICGQPSGSPML
ncbi:hypothetical protein A1O1_09280 [Capronia coronata CBS 617.96]|uniref:Uncharacterized protein n=1 Tax=Capronia coronata CBS 617.96 TaxID=1182541 RepID=W9XFA9_9EURO|nr:uncharacterized protein A1O1_09280 [Capronia coronata CBS 617.96]EXJ78878.1 hypothetical protein A1O1_09280 [Capronia coronata CBS 617.96]